MGEYNGIPNYLLHSTQGLLWSVETKNTYPGLTYDNITYRFNLPPDLEELVKMPDMAQWVKNFALGPAGIYWYTYQSVNGVYEQSEH